MNRFLLEAGLAQTTFHPLGKHVERAEGVWLHLAGGERWMDLICGIGVSAFGHGHPRIKAALHEQIERHLHAMVYGELGQTAQHLAAHRLMSLLPDPLDTVYFVNSGAEAIEGALKLAKRKTGRRGLMACIGGYHGNTHGALSVSYNPARRAPFEPLLPEVDFIPFNDLSALAQLDGRHAAIVVETVQGDAGIRIPDPEWLRTLRQRCDETGTMLILDEIQAGMGRTGRPFAFEHFGVVPDILCLGKALGGGMPIGAFVAPREAMALLAHEPELGHITTFGGHPMACAGAAAALSLLGEVDWASVERRGARLQAALAQHPAVREVRRLGYFIAVECADGPTTNRVVLAAQSLGVLVYWFLSTPQAFRIAPPLTLKDEELEWAITQLLAALDTASQPD
jgi:acetylornithine/succinyldiaminopimelate/putrescine aminotransferase